MGPRTLIFVMTLVASTYSSAGAIGLAVTGAPEVIWTQPEDQTCWDIAAEFEQGCYHEEPLTLDPYPLSEDMFQRAAPYTASDQSLHRAFQRARKSGLLRVLVLGGSVTFGHQCVSPEGLVDQQCAWPHRLEQWFQSMTQDFKTEAS